MYVPHVQQTSHFVSAQVYTRTWMNFVVRTPGDPKRMVPAVKRAVAEVDRHTPIAGVRTVEQALDSQVRHLRLYMYLLGIFGGVAVILAATGIYGLMAYSVAERTREIGIRMALGARRGQVLAMVLRQGLALIVIGLALGLGGAAAGTRYLEGLLFGLTPLDPSTFVYVAAAFSVVALLASYVPARRATRVDPLVALRCE